MATSYLLGGLYPAILDREKRTKILEVEEASTMQRQQRAGVLNLVFYGSRGELRSLGGAA